VRSSSHQYRSRYRQLAQLALPHLGSFQRCLQDRTQDDVLRLLAFDPMAAASAIPVGDFSFILWVVLGL
jgi:hypothetical protein